MIKKKLVEIESRIKEIKAEIALVEDMRPGSLTMQYKDPKRKTGAYYQISYTLDIKSRTEYVRKNCVDDVRQQISNYKRYKELTTEWVTLSIEQSKLKMKLAQEVPK